MYYGWISFIAWLKPEIKWSKGINIKYRTQQPKKGDLVFTLGYPLSYNKSEPILSAGFFSNVLEEGGIKRFVINAAFNVGNSGGPLFDLEGRLLGIVQAKSFLEYARARGSECRQHQTTSLKHHLSTGLELDVLRFHRSIHHQHIL
jgi:hypothetical protein